MHYTTLDDAVEAVVDLGPGALLAKVDVKEAYRNIAVHLVDRHLLGMSWEGRTFVDCLLPFGLRSAPISGGRCPKMESRHFLLHALLR